MPELPRVSAQECVAALERAGFVFVSQKGSHVKYRHSDTGRRCARGRAWGGADERAWVGPPRADRPNQSSGPRVRRRPSARGARGGTSLNAGHAAKTAKDAGCQMSELTTTPLRHLRQLSVGDDGRRLHLARTWNGVEWL